MRDGSNHNEIKSQEIPTMMRCKTRWIFSICHELSFTSSVSFSISWEVSLCLTMASLSLWLLVAFSGRETLTVIGRQEESDLGILLASWLSPARL